MFFSLVSDREETTLFKTFLRGVDGLIINVEKELEFNKVSGLPLLRVPKTCL